MTEQAAVAENKPMDKAEILAAMQELAKTVPFYREFLRRLNVAKIYSRKEYNKYVKCLVDAKFKDVAELRQTMMQNYGERVFDTDEEYQAWKASQKQGAETVAQA